MLISELRRIVYDKKASSEARNLLYGLLHLYSKNLEKKDYTNNKALLLEVDLLFINFHPWLDHPETYARLAYTLTRLEIQQSFYRITTEAQRNFRTVLYHYLRNFHQIAIPEKPFENAPINVSAHEKMAELLSRMARAVYKSTSDEHLDLIGSYKKNLLEILEHWINEEETRKKVSDVVELSFRGFRLDTTALVNRAEQAHQQQIEWQAIALYNQARNTNTSHDYSPLQKLMEQSNMLLQTHKKCLTVRICHMLIVCHLRNRYYSFHHKRDSSKDFEESNILLEELHELLRIPDGLDETQKFLVSAIVFCAMLLDSDNLS